MFCVRSVGRLYNEWQQYRNSIQFSMSQREDISELYELVKSELC
jgi:hypothetical protein